MSFVYFNCEYWQKEIIGNTQREGKSIVKPLLKNTPRLSTSVED